MLPRGAALGESARVSPVRRVAFLRAINVGGHTVTMEALRRHFTALGLTGVETFIASGNVLFDARASDRAALERKIEAHLRKALGYEVVTFVRTAPEVIAVAGHQPFPPARVRAAAAFNIGFLAEPLGASGTRALMTLRTDIDDFAVHGREVYWLCARRQGESTFSNVRFEKQVGVRATFRGASTLARLAAILARAPDTRRAKR